MSEIAANLDALEHRKSQHKTSRNLKITLAALEGGRLNKIANTYGISKARVGQIIDAEMSKMFPDIFTERAYLTTYRRFWRHYKGTPEGQALLQRAREVLNHE